MPLSLEGKVALVTGAAHGVGRGHALELARLGAHVLVNDLGGSVAGEGAGRDADAVVAAIESAGGSALADYGDVSDEAAVESMFDRAVAAWGAVDIVVNNAGIIRDAPIERMPVGDFDVVMRVHVRGTWLVCRSAMRRWRERLGSGSNDVYGRIINTTSGVGMAGNVSETNYAAAKAAIIGLTLALDMEAADAGITCNVVGPSGNTRMAAAAGTNTGASAPLEPGEIDGGWHPHDPSNSSPLVAWLASEQAAHISGQVFRSYGDRIALMSGWYEQRAITNGERRWDPHALGSQVAKGLFGTRHRGWPQALDAPAR
jgi:NAD(P)-dependent dehydrogenase (short-subunit alcohol dehydrogenase family)